MKKIATLMMLAGLAAFQYCSSGKKLQETPKTNFQQDIHPIIMNSCSPCHVPPDGKRAHLNTYEAAKSRIDDIITRINKNPGEKGFMPFKHPKLPDSTIQLFVKWRNDGLLEKQ